ncbi:NHLP leader peptide family RiPP precursor [Dictyobacter formicarum]|uniref:NHLP leader peptide family natural product n=1 Tax=Dictyobacter formicarum TaxID=2778368 RepID=A0ABQ3VGM2_9CHLR|nr:NHLP leader peptide family RiPP precursor [Dictyobacter formicarum]GHO84958.1 hypothetical protein KSZ_29640 [Dictyobacter formicarum]
MTNKHSLEARITARAVNDATFRRNLLHDPKATIEREFAVTFPANAVVRVEQGSNNTVRVILPASGPTEVELDEAQLSNINGGSGNAGQIGGGDVFGPRPGYRDL